MRDLDKYAIEKLEIPGIVLMENAVLKVMKNLDLSKDSYLIVAGSGNNGGDGFGVARQLSVLNKDVKVAFLGKADSISGDALTNYKILRHLNIDVVSISSGNVSSLTDLVSNADMVIDSIFGTGLDKKVSGHYKQAIEAINNCKKLTVSIDLPSGLNADTGQPMGVCISSDLTVTFQYMKAGFKSAESKKYTGEIILESIGIPDWVYSGITAQE